jgi:hypothetical protein
MAMSYSSLIAAKNTSGSIATWVSYTLLDLPPLVDEAQAMLYGEGRLRCREMMADAVFTLQANQSYVPFSSFLPPNASFLEPIGRMNITSFNTFPKHHDSAFVQAARNYNEQSGTLGTNPFTTTSGSNTVSVFLTSHGFTQDSPFSVSGATAFNGVTLNGTFPINGITDANDFTIDITSLGTTPTASGSGGGSAVNYICDVLTLGTPIYFGIWNERVNFDSAVFQTCVGRLQYYQSLPLLSSTNQTNFLTTRYPNLMRVACMAAAADFMKDDIEYQKQFGRLQAMIEKIADENDMQYRGMELDPIIP